MKKTTPPPAPDYAAAATAQGAANTDAARATAKLSNPNIISPYGNQTVSYEGDIPTITQSLTPDAQQTVDAQQRADLGLANLADQQTQNIGGILNTPFSFSGTPSPIAPGQTSQDAIMSRLQPQLDRARTSTETQLVNQGLHPGAEAYDNAIRDLGQQENDQRTQAVLQGIGLDTNAHQNQLAEQLQLRDQPINEIAALMSGSQVQNPQFQQYQGATVGAAPVFQGAQAQDQYNQNLYAQQVAQRNSLMNGLFGLGGTALKLIPGL